MSVVFVLSSVIDGNFSSVCVGFCAVQGPYLNSFFRSANGFAEREDTCE